MLNSKAKAQAFVALRVIVALFVWCAMMLLYFKAHDLIEQDSVPLMLQSKVFSTQSWDQGYFHASGAFENQSAVDPGDELLPQGNDLTCLKETKTCMLATGSIFAGFLNVDSSQFDITSWTDQQITFVDDSPICVTNAYVVDRAAQTMTLLIRKRAVIPDYAAKSELHPCANIKDANIDLADGFKVSQRARTQFGTRNGIYFHAVFLAMNVLFFVAIYWLWRRRKVMAVGNNANAKPHAG